MENIILENSGLVYATARMFSHKYNEDLIGAGFVGLCKAYKIFDKKRGVKFTTLAISCIRNEMIHELRKNNKHKRTILTNLDYFSSKEKIHTTIIKEHMDMLTTKQKEIVNMLYGLTGPEMTKTEIAKKLGVSRDTLRKIIKEIKRKWGNE